MKSAVVTWLLHGGDATLPALTNGGRDEERAQNGHRSASFGCRKPVGFLLLPFLFLQWREIEEQIKEKMKIKDQ